MATHAIINVEGFRSAALYKHWDGHPSTTLPWLEKFNRDFTENRGEDSQYKFAQLIRSTVTMAEEFGLDQSAYTGWGVVPGGRTEEYNYTLHLDGTVSHDIDLI